ncbi:MAG: ubiquitin-like protein Pup [Micrococcales bacterium]|nr:ubiquitin-like protein Pup [Micrococcales bacterium]
MEYQQKRSHRAEDPPEPIDPPAAPPPSAVQDLGSLLDSIDEVLEVDALTFVRSYVQKGGQ